ncbi:GNAT family N-acetyltransferase [Aliiglaciecola lipolytica]|nr:GNAT family N-acetyltransferase [Aliiglaciecola lipolytica]
MKIRQATLADKIELLELEQRQIDAERPFNTAIKQQDAIYYDLNTLLSSAKSYVAVAEIENKIIGIGYAQIRDSKQAFVHDQHIYLGFMYVAPEYRGRRINKLIIETLVSWGKEKGISDFYLDVYSENDAAINAYKKAGFTESIIEMKLSLSS